MTLNETVIMCEIWQAKVSSEKGVIYKYFLGFKLTKRIMPLLGCLVFPRTCLSFSEITHYCVTGIISMK